MPKDSEDHSAFVLTMLKNENRAEESSGCSTCEVGKGEAREEKSVLSLRWARTS
jgi:hypothetical protein